MTDSPLGILYVRPHCASGIITAAKISAVNTNATVSRTAHKNTSTSNVTIIFTIVRVEMEIERSCVMGEAYHRSVRE